MKKKLVKVLLSAALVLSILGSNFSYVGARNVKEDPMSEMVEEATTEEVKPEENVLPDTPLPDVGTGDNQVNGETQIPDSESAPEGNGEVVEGETAGEEEALTNEVVATLSDEGEEEIPEITDKSVLIEGRNVGANYNDVCTGGGYPNSSSSNPNDTKKPNQNPNSEWKYWDYDSNGFGGYYSEWRLIEKYWPKNKGEAVNHGYRLNDAVIEPKDRCYYANPQNGWGESVYNSADFYYRYDKDWGNGIGQKITPNPTGSDSEGSQQVNVNDIRYCGNYKWVNRNGGHLFTIVTRPVLEKAAFGHYHWWSGKEWVKDVGQYYIDGTSYPRVKDRTGDLERELDPKGSMYWFKQVKDHTGAEMVNGAEFKGIPSKMWGSSPTKPGWYNVRIQTPVDQRRFILPGQWSETVMYLNKGYKIKFQKQFDGNTVQDIGGNDWVAGKRPASVDEQTKKDFNIDMYLHKTEYKIPEPAYDSNKYIFEGWEAREKKWMPADPNDPIDSGKMITVTVPIEKKDSQGNYLYTPSEITDEQFFVLDSTIVAKFKTRKTNTVNVKLNFIEDESGLPDRDKATLDKTSIKLIEQIKNNEQFTITLQDKPFDFLGYSKNADGTNPLATNHIWNPGEGNSLLLPDNQLQTHMTTEINAVVRPKQITIKLDPNGGKIKPGAQNPEDIKSYYYKSERIHTHNFENGELVLKGWAETPNGDVKVINGESYKIEDVKVNGKYPSEKTLYAVWGKATATVHAEKFKDVLFYPTVNEELAANTIYTAGSGEIKAYELGRFYLNVEPANHNAANDQSKLDPAKFYIVIEHSTDGKNWRKLPIDDISSGAIITAAFGDKSSGPFAKVVYDNNEKKWFVPLLGRVEKMDEGNSYKGFYRVNVAYDDDDAVEEVTTEQDFIAGKGKNGWSESDKLQVRVVQSPDAFINVPSTITLEERTEVNVANGTTKEIIESVHSSNKVTVVPFEHANNTTDYDWLTPNNALVENRTGSYNNQMHEEFIKNKPFYVSIKWDGRLTDLTGKYEINNIDMYSADNIKDIKKDQIITGGTKNSFTYDGTNTDKTLFDFYLKGDKPKGLPEGLQLKGRITFTVSPIAQ